MVFPAGRLDDTEGANDGGLCGKPRFIQNRPYAFWELFGERRSLIGSEAGIVYRQSVNVINAIWKSKLKVKP